MLMAAPIADTHQTLSRLGSWLMTTWTAPKMIVCAHWLSSPEHVALPLSWHDRRAM